MSSSPSSESHLDHSSVVPHLHDNRPFDDARSQEFEDNFDDEVDFTPPAEDTPSMQSPAEVYTLAVPPVALPGPPHLQPPPRISGKTSRLLLDTSHDASPFLVRYDGVCRRTTLCADLTIPPDYETSF